LDQILVVPLQQGADVEDMAHIGMIEGLVNEKSFYFSYNYNLTHTLQNNVKKVVKEEESKGLQKKGGSEEFWSQFDTNLVFNRVMCSEWDTNTNEHLWEFITPLIYGYVFVHAVHFDQKKAEFILISRKDCKRLGRRFVSRGLDKDGNASNFVEAEHIIVHKEEDSYRVASYVQTRGSIPLIWTQTPTLKYSPKLEINEDEKINKAAATKHFDASVKKYGEHILINLIDKKGSQKKIGDAFTKLIKNLGNDKLTYEWFDFHHECRKMKWENLSKLIDNIKDKMDSFDYFMAKLDYGFDNKDKLNSATCLVMCNQIGVCRTNCMDCLDRTNVVQSVISRLIMHRQLWKMNILGKPMGDPFESFPKRFEELFRQAWTNNANVCSILYSGTPALKTDFTLTGKRTMQGAVMDGYNSTIRYYINNFCDFYNQDVLDNTLMKLKPDQKMRQKGIFKFSFILSAIILGLVIFNTVVKYMLGIHNIEPTEPEYSDPGYFMRFLHLIIFFGATGFFVKKVFM
jgi:phosphatidylinositol 4-phosphatase